MSHALIVTQKGMRGTSETDGDVLLLVCWLILFPMDLLNDKLPCNKPKKYMFQRRNSTGRILNFGTRKVSIHHGDIFTHTFFFSRFTEYASAPTSREGVLPKKPDVSLH